jgi:nucleoside-diphosphate-sugar epimerase
MVYGPTIVTHDFTMSLLYDQYLHGKVPGVAKFMCPFTDVRDAAIAHVKAVSAEKVRNQRCAVISANIWFKELADILAEHYNP